MCKRHALGALQMVKHNGGFQTLGMNGFLEYLVEKLWRDVQEPPLAFNNVAGVPRQQ
jgi:hypothetical protein